MVFSKLGFYLTSQKGMVVKWSAMQKYRGGDAMGRRVFIFSPRYVTFRIIIQSSQYDSLIESEEAKIKEIREVYIHDSY